MRQRSRATVLSKYLSSIALILLLAASQAQAVEGPAPMEQADRAAGERAVADWQARNSWHYGSDAIFGLSRGLEEAGVARGGRIALWFVTVPLDLMNLPAAVLAGLWGD